MDLKQKISDIVNDCIENDQTFLVEVDIKGNPNNQKILVFIDGDQAVNIDECSKISRKLSNILEEEDLIEGRYVIEVSSPGASKPLKYLRQYPKHIGRDLEITKKDKSKITGELAEVLEDEIVVSVQSQKSREAQKISFSEIDSTKVLIRF